MLTDLLDGRRCRCGSGRFSRLYGEETRTRISFVVLCEGCGHLDRAVYSDTTPAHPPTVNITSPN